MDEGKNPGFGPFPDSGGDPDADFDEFVAWLDREEDSGRDPVPAERAPEPAGISVCLGSADGIDPGLLRAVCGPDGDGRPGGEGLGPQFGQDAAADTLPPGPALAALTEAAVSDVTRLTDNQLIGVLQAARRQENREAWKKALVIAEFSRRRAAEFEAATARGVRVHCRPGQFPGEELAIELLAGPVQTSHAIDDATDLATRLPRTLAGMAAGLIDEARAGVIALYTRSLAPADTTLADDILAALAPTLRLDQLIRKAAALEMKLAPEAVRARREHARRTRQRVEVRREESGNASVAAREMDTGDALASKAHIHGLALRLRRAGLSGTLDQLRLLVFADLTVGRSPLDRIPRPAARDMAPPSPCNPDLPTPNPSGPTPATSNPADGDAVADDCNPGDAPPPEAPDDEDREQDTGQPPAEYGTRPGSLDYDDCNLDDDTVGHAPATGPPAPMPAMINLVVHAGTLFGWDTTPTEADGWGLLDSDETRAIVAAVSRHAATRWCFTLLGPDGSAATHGCSPGQHPWTPHDHLDPPTTQNQQCSARFPNSADPGGGSGVYRAPPPGTPGPSDRADLARTADPRMPTRGQVAQLTEFLRRLNITPIPIAKGGCDHATAEPRYSPSRKLAHLVRARTATCDAPGCAAQSVHADLDHTAPYPDGPTDQCNLGPKCRRHHKAKQAPDWRVEQPEPDLTRWTLPSGRAHTTRPTVYVV